ncbi:aminopeptidase P family protein [Aureimonas leprariae]|uniref:Aminopeptidase P family protein n=1 Tax=Plantimonas leprariae TaxID=2615207 RepID=A0A7V7TXM8_9HYPH|nr:aminopeptidase P family protein [Aureimonas leprariae]KAB0681265.1 aminopeptidase P family protein [Aureimonas leprariae]
MNESEQAQRLETLRSEMRREDLAALIVPRADEVQGEYVAPSSERLRFVSGFTGSAGMAAVGRERAALFVDGRYTIQVRRQALLSFWEYRHLIDEPIEGWAAANLARGERIGYDPRLHTPGQIRQMEAALGSQGLRLVPTEGNLVDRVWRDRPAEPQGAVELWPEEFAGESAAAKRGRIAAELTEKHLDALVVSAPDNLAWAFNIRGEDVAMLPIAFGTAILMADGTGTLFMAPEKLSPQVRSAIATADGGIDIREPAEFAHALDGLKDRRVRVDRATAGVAIIQALEAAGATADVGPDPISLMKAVKSEAELSGAREAHRRDAKAVVRFLNWFDGEDPSTLTEWTAAEKLETFRAGGNRHRGPSFATISAFAGNAAQAHYHADEASAARLGSDAIYLVDSGAQYLDGTTDITRTLATGTPSDEMRRRYTQVLKGHIAVSRARFPQGVTGAQIDTLARQFLWASGVDYDHGTGHGVGAYLSVHEGPQSLSKRGTETPLQPGMIVSNEPGYYKEGAFGIRIENLLAVVELDPQPAGAERRTLGFETLTFVPYDRRLIDVALLTTEERRFVDEYHASVRERLEGDLEAADRDWLIRATEPLAAA